MSFDFAPEIGEPTTFNACIKVIGVGGGGGNAVEHMIDKKAQGITFIAANTDQQALNRSRADIVIPLGKTGLGAGAKPEVGAAAAMDATDQIRESLEGTHLLFITAGMGGGTGTGAAPVIAKIAKELGILTVAVVTKPFEFEGSRRMRQAQAGIENLKEQVDSLIVILNDKLEEEVGDNATMVECFAAADDVLYKACNGIAEIIHTPGLINVDFEDLRTVMSERGTAMMGTATAAGPDRAREAGRYDDAGRSASGYDGHEKFREQGCYPAYRYGLRQRNGRRVARYRGGNRPRPSGFRHAVAAAGERSSARGDSLQFDFGSAACRYAAADGCDGSSDARCCSAAGL